MTKRLHSDVDVQKVFQFYSKSKKSGHNDPKVLSNFSYGARIAITLYGKKVSALSVEALFQYAKYQFADKKSGNFDPDAILEMSPKDAKFAGGRKGMTINGYKLKQDEWDGMIMKTIVAARFEQDENFQRALMATGDDYLLHFSRSDKTWGGLIPKTLERSVDNVKGKNALGIMLMELREKANLHTRIN